MVALFLNSTDDDHSDNEFLTQAGFSTNTAQPLSGTT